MLYVDAESHRAVLFAFQGGDRQLQTTLRLRGLEKGGRCQVRLPQGLGPERTVSGDDLIARGLTLQFPHRGTSAVIAIQPQ